MRLASIVLTVIVLSSIAVAQTQAYVPFPNQTPEKQKAGCADIEQRNTERMQQGLPAVHPYEELCYPPKTFGFANKPDPQGLKQVVTLLRTIVQMSDQQISVDPEASTITLRAAPGKLEMAGWMLRELDQPAVTPGQRTGGASMHELAVPRSEQDQPGKNDEVMRVYFLAHTATQQGIEEILTCARVIGDVQKVFNDNEQFALIVRAPAAQAELFAYLIKALDVEPGSRTPVADFLYRAPARPFARPVPGADTAPSDVVRVFYPAHATSPKSIQQMMIALRTVVGIQKIFMDTSAGAIPVRGTPGDIAAAAWVIQSLDVAADAQATPPAGKREFRITDSPANATLRVLYLGKDVRPDGLQSLLKQVQLEQPGMLSASSDTAAALVIRGSDEQMAQAERSVRDALAVVN